MQTSRAGPANPRALLQLDSLNLSHESAAVFEQEAREDVEHGVREAIDVQDVVTARGLSRAIRLDVDADQLRSRSITPVLARLSCR